ncbi:serine protease [Bacillus sp. AGMB 02131]|uniref:Serine protease n=1 Tax=Peribacillus faecalis TaxID=2772559 RepID=A0A927HBM1_9BACI|nr:CAP domain-containing protein [Peribacillus faecalis]MBD3107543.1 serine protease [Peribacillus faecalis]
MNKKVLVSLAAAAAVTFTGFGAGSADAASKCTNNQYTQYQKYVQIKCLTKEDVESLKDSLYNLLQNMNCTKPETDSPVIDNQKPETDSPVTDNQKPETDSPVIDNQKPETDSPVIDNQKPETDSPVTDSQKPETNTPEIENPTPEVDTNKPGTEIQGPSTGEENTSTEVSAFEREVLELTNVERTKAGLSPLTLDTELSKVARIKSQDMKDQNYFSHTSPTYGSPFDMMTTFGISYKSAAENIAQGQTTPAAVVEAWMNSQGHRENILNASYTHIGIGHVSDGNYWTQMFIGK